MKIDIKALSFKLTAPIRRHAEKRAERALQTLRFADAGATVRLSDVNADRGGVDKSCRISIRAPRLGTMTAEAMDQNLYSAIDRAYTRLNRLIRRRIDRRRTLQRRGAHSAAWA